MSCPRVMSRLMSCLHVMSRLIGLINLNDLDLPVGRPYKELALALLDAGKVPMGLRRVDLGR